MCYGHQWRATLTGGTHTFSRVAGDAFSTHPARRDINATGTAEVFCLFNLNFDGLIRIGEYDQHNNFHHPCFPRMPTSAP